MPERDEALFDRLMADTDSDWPDKLLHDLARAPLTDEPTVNAMLSTYPAAMREDLSDRELEVLRYASHGLEATHTAELLFLSPHTVRSHLKTARFRLKAKNTAHACCLALRQGLFE